MTNKEKLKEQIRQHRHERPLTKKEIERFEKYLEESGYNDRLKSLEDTVANKLNESNNQ